MRLNSVLGALYSRRDWCSTVVYTKVTADQLRLSVLHGSLMSVHDPHVCFNTAYWVQTILG